MGKKLRAGMKTHRLYNAQSPTGSGALLRKGTDKKHDPPPPKSFVDDVKRKLKLKHVMGKHSESLFDNSDDPVDGQWEKEDANYRYAADPTKACEHCEHFIAPNTCEIIAGLIRPVDVCDKFEPLEKPGFQMGGLVPSQLIVQSEAMAVVRRKTDYVQEWLSAKKDPKFATCIKQAENEVAPPGWEGTVKAMKKHPEIDNPWALSWWMKGQGATSHKTSEDEGGPGSGPSGGAGKLMIDRIRDLPKDKQHKAAQHLRKEEEGGPGSGPGGKSKFQPEKPESDEDKQVGMFTRREKPAARQARIKQKKVDPHQAKAIQRAFLVVRASIGHEGGPGSGPRKGGGRGGRPTAAGPGPMRPAPRDWHPPISLGGHAVGGMRKVMLPSGKTAIVKAGKNFPGQASEGVMDTMGQGLARPQPDHQQFEWTGLSHGRRGGN